MFESSAIAIPNNHFPTIVQHLGKGKQFFPLHEIKSKDKFYFALKNSSLWKQYVDEKAELNLLLEEVKFKEGINSKDLTIDKIKDTTLQYGIVGNLGGVRNNNGDRKIEYVFSKLNVGPKFHPIPAWKITGPSGCYFYILRKCGNAFYPKIFTTDTCCHNININVTADKDTLRPHYIPKLIYLTICNYNITRFYARDNQIRTKTKIQRKTNLLCKDDTIKICKDTVLQIMVPDALTSIVYLLPIKKDTQICKNIDVIIKGQLKHEQLDEPVTYPRKINRDTIKLFNYSNRICSSCQIKFELGINGGLAYNTIPTISNDVIHTKSSKAHFAGDIYLGYLITKQVQIGVDVGYFTLTYKDDFLYPKPVGSFQTYNDIYLAKPVIPIQAYGKVNFGSGNLTSQVSLSLGYSIVSNSQIENNGTLLNSSPDIKGGLVAGLGLGFDYFFNCHFGIGAGVKANYFNLKGDQQSYNLFAFPAIVGLRYRF